MVCKALYLSITLICAKAWNFSLGNCFGPVEIRSEKGNSKSDSTNGNSNTAGTHSTSDSAITNAGSSESRSSRSSSTSAPRPAAPTPPTRTGTSADGMNANPVRVSSRYTSGPGLSSRNSHNGSFGEPVTVVRECSPGAGPAQQHFEFLESRFENQSQRHGNAQSPTFSGQSQEFPHFPHRRLSSSSTNESNRINKAFMAAAREETSPRVREPEEEEDHEHERDYPGELPHSLDEGDMHNEVQEPLSKDSCGYTVTESDTDSELEPLKLDSVTVGLDGDQVPEKRKILSPFERLWERWEKPHLNLALCCWNSDTKQYEYHPERFRWDEDTKRYKKIEQHPDGPDSLVLALPVDGPGPVVLEERVFQEIKRQEGEKLSGLLKPDVMWQQQEPHRTLDSFDDVPQSAVERQSSQEHRVFESFEQVLHPVEEWQRLQKELDDVLHPKEEWQKVERDRIVHLLDNFLLPEEERQRLQKELDDVLHPKEEWQKVERDRIVHMLDNFLLTDEKRQRLQIQLDDVLHPKEEWQRVERDRIVHLLDNFLLRRGEAEVAKTARRRPAPKRGVAEIGRTSDFGADQYRGSYMVLL